MVAPFTFAHEPPPPSNSRLARYLSLCTVALPCTLFFLNSDWNIPAFSPQQVIYSSNLIPLIFAPWAGPTSFLSAISRLLQAALFWRLSLGVYDLALGYGLWIIVALARTVTGYLLTRGVGWAYPGLFRHYALYELSAGCGVMLVGRLLTLEDAELSRITWQWLRPRYFVVGFSMVLCWLDNEPWTYGITVLAISILSLLYPIFLRVHPKDYLPLGNAHSTTVASRRPAVHGMALLLFLTIIMPYSLSSWLFRRPDVPMPNPPFTPSRLLDIIVLSFPRPDVEAEKEIMMTTLSSYLPLLSTSVSLAVFTHAKKHSAFDEVRKAFSPNNITFYQDLDSHPDAKNGQYLHLAEAFRWQSERGSTQAEWVMLIEDDFPLCGRTVGQKALRIVMRLLEDGREDGEVLPKRRGAFIGTGGSGLIFHRSLLPVLIHILRTHSDISSKLPPGIPARPADIVMQDCLLGLDPLCPPKQPRGLIITSTLVMDHIGGMASTNTRKAGNSDKWRCGWRHPFHGRTEVDVVVVNDLR